MNMTIGTGTANLVSQKPYPIAMKTLSMGERQN